MDNQGLAVATMFILDLCNKLSVIADAFKTSLYTSELRVHIKKLDTLSEGIEDQDIRLLIVRASSSIYQRWYEYEDPDSSVMLKTPHRAEYAMKIYAWITVVNVGLDLLFDTYTRSVDPGEVLLDNEDPNDPGFKPSKELKLKLPSLEQFRAHVPDLSEQNILYRWKMINREQTVREQVSKLCFNRVDLEKDYDGMNILNVVTDNDRQTDYEYLRRVYVEQDPTVIHVRWEWGRFFWTAVAITEMGQEKSRETIIRGRQLELRARKFVVQHGMLTEH